MVLVNISAYSIKCTFLLSLFVFLLFLPTLARPEIIVNPDGSAYLEELLPDSNNVNDKVIVSPNAPLVNGDTITIDFNDLNYNEQVTLDRYIDSELQINIGPSSTINGNIFGSAIDGPCDGTTSIQTVPFTGPSFLFRFPDGVNSVSIESGDFGPSDSDLITITAFSDDALTTIVDSDTVFIAQASARWATYSSCSTYSQVSLSQRGQIRGGMPPLYLP